MQLQVADLALAKLLPVAFKSGKSLENFLKALFYHFICILFYDWNILSVCRPDATKMQNKLFWTSQTCLLFTHTFDLYFYFQYLSTLTFTIPLILKYSKYQLL